jgi:flagellar FlgN protein
MWWYEEAMMGLREVSTILWRERHLLELLLFKLEEEQLLLAAGRNRWLPRATREVEMVLEELKHTELERAVEVERVAPELALPPHASLRELCEAAPPPWQEMLTDHRQAFLTLTEEVAGLVQTNRELLARGQRAVREVMASIGEAKSEAGGGYGPGRDLGVKPLLIDRAF